MRGYLVYLLLVISVLWQGYGAESKGLNLHSGQTKITDFLSGLFGSNGNGSPGGGPSGGNGSSGPNGGGPSGGNGSSGPNGGGPSGGNGGPGPNGGGPSGGIGGPFNPEEEFKLMEMLNLGKPDEPAQTAGPRMEALQKMLRMSVVPPWVSLFEAEMEPTPEFRFPSYVLELNDTNGINGSSRTVMNKIDFATVLPVLRTVLQDALKAGIPLHRIMRTLAPRLYNIKAGCPVNILQKVLSKCAKNWADDRMMVIAGQLSEYTDEDIRPLTEAIKQEVISEVNRAIFGTEFQEFDELLRFMQMSVNWNLKVKNTTVPGPNNDTDPLDMVLGLTQYVIQCKDRQSFLQEMIARLQVLKRRVINAKPFPFTARILKKLPFQCAHPSDRPGPKMLKDIYDGTAFVLNAVQKSLGRLVDYVGPSLFFGEPSGFKAFLPENILPELLDSLSNLRNADDVPPFVLMPPPLPTPGNYTDMDMSPLPPMNNTNDTFWSPSPGNVTLHPSYWNNTTPSGNYSKPSINVTTNATPPSGSPTTTNPTPSTPARRSQNYSKVKLLKLLLRGLVAAKRKK